MLINTLNELGEKIGYTTKSYNLLGVALMLNSDLDRAIKIFDIAVSELKLDTPEGEQKHLYSGNNDLSSILVNYIKCHTATSGSGQGLEFFKSDPLNQKLFLYLGKINQQMLAGFFEERRAAESMFDDAVK